MSVRLISVFTLAVAVVIIVLSAGCNLSALQGRSQSTPAQGPIRFEDRYSTSGIDFRLGHNGRSPLNIQDTIGHGIALLDCDGDGNLDIIMTGPDRVRLYKNIGNFHFIDITEGSGLRQKGYWQGIAVGDVDNDGRPDLYLAGKGEAALYRNLGGGHFQDMTAVSGLKVTDLNRWNSAAFFFDYDHDGKLDLLVGAYVNLGTNSGLCRSGDAMMACAPITFSAQKAVLYHNTGSWHFKPLDLRGLTHGKVLGAIGGDLYGDGGVELYLANDVMEADLLRYQGKDHWRADGVLSGTAFNADGHAMGGMGVSVADYDGDGRLDMIVGTFSRDPRSLFHNDGGGLFSNRGFQSGISGLTTFYVAFGTEFADLDNDGWPDLVMVNGHVQDQPQRLDKDLSYAEPTQILRNLGDGRFADVSAGAGPAVSQRIVGRALCVGDLDNDGKLDLVIGNLEGPPLILHNISPSPNHWLRVKLVGKTCNRDGQGAVVTCSAGGRKQVKLATTGGSYYAASDPRIHFGLANAQKVDGLTVRWPGGKQQQVSEVTIDREIEVRQP